MTNTLAAVLPGDRAGVPASESDAAVPVGAPVSVSLEDGLASSPTSPGALARVKCSRASGDSLGAIQSGGGPELPWIELNLPTPPSVNRFMGKLGNKSPIVKSWIVRADLAFVLARAKRWSDGGGVITKIIGKFETQLTFERDRSDFHNRLKPLFDWLQRVELIQNDRLCEHLDASWGPPKTGCLVRLRPFMGEST